uniref:EML-like first beta-propeller domain-containing protein n=1 Tax=Laticauda laticaudata TaxID=8630 RepID=A0A8C5SZ30_LATLA
SSSSPNTSCQGELSFVSNRTSFFSYLCFCKLKILCIPSRMLRIVYVLNSALKASIFVCSFSQQLLPHVRIWDSVTLNTLHVIGMGFFDRAVTCIAFSKSNGGSNLCSVDDSNDHVLSVWDWQREEKVAEVKCSNEAVFAADFHPTDTNIIVTCGKSHLYFWTIEGNSLIKKQGLFEKQEKPKFVLCVTFSENGDTITGDSSGNILVWGKGKERMNLYNRWWWLKSEVVFSRF